VAVVCSVPSETVSVAWYVPGPPYSMSKLVGSAVPSPDVSGTPSPSASSVQVMASPSGSEPESVKCTARGAEPLVVSDDRDAAGGVSVVDEVVDDEDGSVDEDDVDAEVVVDDVGGAVDDVDDVLDEAGSVVV